MKMLALNSHGIKSTMYHTSDVLNLISAYYAASEYYTSENNSHWSVAFRVISVFAEFTLSVAQLFVAQNLHDVALQK